MCAASLTPSPAALRVAKRPEKTVDSPLVPIFLAVIALTAFLHAAVVAGLALALRIAGRKLAEVEQTLAAQIETQGESLSRVTEAAVRASEKTLAQAERLEAVVTDASAKVESVMSAVSRRIEEAAARVQDDEEEAAGAGVYEEEAEEFVAPVRSRLSGAAAVIRGVQRAVEVWRDSAPDAARRRDY
jgi:hypothetical protein